MNSGLMGKPGLSHHTTLDRGRMGGYGGNSQGSGSGVVNISKPLTFNNADPGSEARIRVAIANGR